MKNLFQILNKLTEYLFYFLILILPFQTRWIIKAGELNGSYFEYKTISLYLTDVVLILLISIILYLKFSKKYKTEKTKLDLLWIIIGGIEIIVFISSLFSSDLVLSFYIYLRFLLGLGLFWLVSNFRYSLKRLVVVLMVGILIQSFIGIFQFGIGESFSSTTLGMASHSYQDLGASVVEVEEVRHLRAYGSFDHPNIFGGFLAISLLFFILISLSQKGLKKDDFRARLKNTLFAFSFVLGTVSLFLTFSRAAWLAFFLGLIAILFLSILRSDLKVQKKMLQFILLVGIIFYALFIPYGNLVSTRFSMDEKVEIKSISERVSYLGESKMVIQDNLLIGVGMGNYTNYIYDEIDDSGEFWRYQPVHNTFLLIWAEIGIIGLIFMIGIFQVLFLGIVKERKKSKSKEVYKLSIIVALLVLFMLDHWLWSLHFGVFWFWFVVGLLVIKFRRKHYWFF